MGLQFAPTLAPEQPALINFLTQVFHADPELNSFQPEVLQWKYFIPYPEWSQPRSFSLKKDQEIVSHGGILPIRLRARGGELQAINLIDWAASAAALGGGVHVLRNIAAMCDIMITIGGSSDTRKILPKLGYRPGGTLRRYVRVTQPWLQMRTRRHYDWKTLARFIRNSSSVFKSLPNMPAAWRVDKVTQFGGEIEPLLQVRDSLVRTSPIRSVANLNYMLACPASEFSAFVVSEGQRPTGYFVLSKIGRQARIVDLGVEDDNPKLWALICATAAQTARQDQKCVELIVGTSSEEVGGIFEQLGFRPFRQDEILYYDPRNRLAPGTRLNLNLIDSDFSFMYNPNYPYVS